MDGKILRNYFIFQLLASFGEIKIKFFIYEYQDFKFGYKIEQLM